jgi:hypothetical protein
VSELSGINLLTATLELGVVRMLRGAMRAADLGAAAHLGGGGGGGGGAGSPNPNPAASFTPTPKFRPRTVYTPTPRFEPRPVFHPTPRFEPLERCPAPSCPEQPRISPSPIEPVWKTLPSVPPPLAAQDIKVHIVRPDIRHKGTLIDTVI